MLRMLRIVGPRVRQRCPALVIAPAAGDLQVARRVALEPEAVAGGHPARRFVLGLDVGLDAVKSQAPESVPQGESDAFGQVAARSEGPPDVVPHKGALEWPIEDLTEVDGAHDRIVIEPADQQALVLRRAQAAQVGRVRRQRHRGRDQAAVELAARAVERHELGPVGTDRMSEIAIAAARKPSHPRCIRPTRAPARGLVSASPGNRSETGGTPRR